MVILFIFSPDIKLPRADQVLTVLTVTVTGEVAGGDPITFYQFTEATKLSNVGSYPILIFIGINHNYHVIPVDGTLSIGQKAATVTAESMNKTYGEDNPALTATVIGEVVDGDAINYRLYTAAGQISGVGNYPITVTPGSNPNYSVKVTDGTLSIGQKAANVTADSTSKTYGDDNPTLTATVAGTVTDANGSVAAPRLVMPQKNSTWLMLPVLVMALA